MRSYTRWFGDEFGQAHDQFRLLGQDNLRRYLPIQRICVRVDPGDSLFELVARVCAAKIAGCRIDVSQPADAEFAPVRLLDTLTDSWAAAIKFVGETDGELANRISRRQVDHLRYASPARVPRIVRQVAPDVQFDIAAGPSLLLPCRFLPLLECGIIIVSADSRSLHLERHRANVPLAIRGLSP